MNKHYLDTEDFISEVKKYPALWDIQCDAYKSSNKRRQAWTAIARALIDQFDELPSGEKFNIYKKVQDKWRNIRDSYVKSLKNNKKSPYMYARRLQFLNENYNFKNSSHSESEEPCSEDRPRKKIKKEKRSYEESNDAWPSDELGDECEDSNLEQKMKNADEIEFVDTFPDVAGTLYTEEDEDRSFFNSLLPAVRQFSVDQKLEFRSEVITIIKKIRADVS